MALLLPVLLMITLGTVDFGRAFYYYVTVSGGAQAGADYAGRHNTTTDLTSIRLAVLREAGLPDDTKNDGTAGSVDVTCEEVDATNPTMAKVTVTYRFGLITPIPIGSLTLPIAAYAAAPLP